MAHGLLKRTTDDKQAENLYATLFDATANQTIIISPVSGAMPPAQLRFEGLHHVKADALYAPEDKKYIHTHPAVGIRFRPSSEGLFEAVVVKGGVFEDEQPVLKLFPHLFEYPTKDLFAPHPSKADLWTHGGMVDDTISSKSGYICDQITMEHFVSHYPKVRAVLMAGTGRSQPALLIEGKDNPSSSPTTQQELTERTW